MMQDSNNQITYLFNKKYIKNHDINLKKNILHHRYSHNFSIEKQVCLPIYLSITLIMWQVYLKN